MASPFARRVSITAICWPDGKLMRSGPEVGGEDLLRGKGEEPRDVTRDPAHWLSGKSLLVGAHFLYGPPNRTRSRCRGHQHRFFLSLSPLLSLLLFAERSLSPMLSLTDSPSPSPLPPFTGEFKAPSLPPSLRPALLPSPAASYLRRRRRCSLPLLLAGARDPSDFHSKTRISGLE